MDLYCMDKKLSELGEHDFDELLDTGVFAPASQTNMMDHFGLEGTMDGDWLDNFLIDPVVLNDRMISDAMQPQNVQSEHSYSLAKGETQPDSQLSLKMGTKEDKGMDPHLMQTVNPNMTLTMTQENIDDIVTVKQEDSDMADPMDLSISQQHQPMIITTTTSTSPSDHPQTLLRTPTIIVATSTSGVGGPPDLQMHQLTYAPSEESLLITNVKQEPLDSVSLTSSPDHSDAYDSLGLPPTPPSTSGSDSDASQSPRRSPPSSPIHKLTYASQSQYSLGQSVITSTVSFQPIPSSGMLLLSEEEKRTLIAEGYPIPAKLPLTKHEEKNLKKVRRKIKNKISAQESRRKKKEYLENLEKRLELYNKENTDLKRQVVQLETSNSSLTMQLQKLQNLVGKVTGMSGVNSPKASTCLMVLVLSFALFLGAWSPLTGGGMGQPSIGPMPMPVSHGMGGIRGNIASTLARDANKVHMGPEIGDPYSTPSVRSRVLMSVKDEGEETGDYAPHLPFTYKDLFIHWFSSEVSAGAMTPRSSDGATVRFDSPMTPNVEVTDKSLRLDQPSHQSIQPDMAADVPTKVAVNATS